MGPRIDYAEIPQSVHLVTMKKKKMKKMFTRKQMKSAKEHRDTLLRLREFWRKHPNGIKKLTDDIINYYQDFEDNKEFLQTKFYDDLEKLKEKKIKLKRLEGNLDLWKIEEEKKRSINETSETEAFTKNVSIETGLVCIPHLKTKDFEFTTIKQVKKFIKKLVVVFKI